MIKSKFRKLNILLNIIRNSKLGNIELYIHDIKKEDFLSFQNEEEIEKFFQENINLFFSLCVFRENSALRSYTGYHFRNINALLRGRWNYEIMK